MIESSEQCSTNAYKHQPVPTPLVPVLVPVAGRGVAKDYVEAVKWYRKAAEQGHTEAQFNLGYCYANGQGVGKDKVEAYAWFSMAAKADSDAAKSRDLLRKELTPQQFTDAQKRMKELRWQIAASDGFARR